MILNSSLQYNKTLEKENLIDLKSSLKISQQVEFTRAIKTKEQLEQSLIKKGFDSAIAVNLKLKPKFTLVEIGRRANLVREQFSLSQAKLSIPKYLGRLPISLIVPVYNREPYLAATIESILAQTFTDFELIVWDDGSSDNSKEIADYYAKKDKRIKVFSNINIGHSKALNKAISLAGGKYIGTVDSDDLLHPEALNKAWQVLESNPNWGMVYTDCWIINAEGDKRGLDRRSSIPYSSNRLLSDFMTFHFRLIRRDIFNAVGGFNSELDSAEDYDLCLRISEITKIEHLPEPLYYYRRHQNSISTAQQFKQTLCSTVAVNQAIQRRGLDAKLKLEVKLNPSYHLQRQDKVANKVFGIGLSKTGTSSLNAALCLLGIPSVHLPRSLNLVKEFDGATDMPVALAYQELDLLYPDSKFILTVREIYAWLNSYRVHKQKLLKIYAGNIPQWLEQISVDWCGQWEFEPNIYKKAYNHHLDSAIAYFKDRESDFLILDICGGQGWQELCNFLNCSVPNSPFPHENKANI